MHAIISACMALDTSWSVLWFRQACTASLDQAQREIPCKCNFRGVGSKTSAQAFFGTRSFGHPKPQKLAEMKFWDFSHGSRDKTWSEKLGGLWGEILVGCSAQWMKHENAQKCCPKFRPIFRPIFRPVIKICRQNFALGNVRCKVSGPKHQRRLFWYKVFRQPFTDVRAENHGRPVVGRNFSTQGQECPREIRTKKCMFMLFFLPWLKAGQTKETHKQNVHKILLGLLLYPKLLPNSFKKRFCGAIWKLTRWKLILMRFSGVIFYPEAHSRGFST